MNLTPLSREYSKYSIDRTVLDALSVVLEFGPSVRVVDRLDGESEAIGPRKDNGPVYVGVGTSLWTSRRLCGCGHYPST